MFWLLCLAYAPARRNEKPGALTERGCSDLKQEFKREEGRRDGFWQKVSGFGQSVDTGGSEQRRGGDKLWRLSFGAGEPVKLAIQLHCQLPQCKFEPCNTLHFLNARVLRVTLIG